MMNNTRMIEIHDTGLKIPIIEKLFYVFIAIITTIKFLSIKNIIPDYIDDMIATGGIPIRVAGIIIIMLMLYFIVLDSMRIFYWFLTRSVFRLLKLADENTVNDSMDEINDIIMDINNRKTTMMAYHCPQMLSMILLCILGIISLVI